MSKAIERLRHSIFVEDLAGLVTHKSRKGHFIPVGGQAWTRIIWLEHSFSGSWDIALPLGVQLTLAKSRRMCKLMIRCVSHYVPGAGGGGDTR